MSKRIYFTPTQMRILESNPNVVHVSEKSINYSPEFKLQAIKSYKSGITPIQIFREAGFDIATIGTRNPRTSLEGLLMERRQSKYRKKNF